LGGPKGQTISFSAVHRHWGITQYLLAYLARPRAERIFSLQRRKEELLEVQLDWILRVRLRKVQFKVFIGVILVV